VRLLVIAATLWAVEASALADAPCSRAAVADEVRALGGASLDEIGDRVRLDFKRVHRRVEGHVTYVTTAGEIIGPRVVTAATCEELSRSLALVIVMSLRADEPPVDGPPPSREPLVIATHAHARPAASQIDVLLGAASDAARLPALVLGSRWRRSRVSLGLELHLRAPETIDVGDGSSIRVARTGLEAVPCGYVGRVALCGLATAGMIAGEGQQLASASSVRRATFAVGGRVEVTLGVSDRIAIRLHADGLRALTHTRFLVDQMPAWTSDSHELWLGGGVLATFP
jgi:hypothetical protein